MTVNAGSEHATSATLPTGATVLLRKLVESDRDLMFKWINDRDLVVMSAPFKPVSRSEHDKWFDSVRVGGASRIFAITNGTSNHAIGYCQLKGVGGSSDNAELQIRIGDASQFGKGLGTAAVKELLSYAFHNLNLHRVQLNVFKTNIRAYKTYLKVGFVEEGTMRQGVKIDGAFVDVILMGILRHEFLALR